MCVSMSDPGMHGAAHAPPVPRPAADDRRTSCAERLGERVRRPSRPAAGPSGPGRCGKRSRSRATRRRSASTRRKTTQWTIARLTDAGRRRMAEVAGDHSADWQGLGVSILHRLVIDTLLGLPPICPLPSTSATSRKWCRVWSHGDAAGRDATGQQGTGGRFELAALVMPATVEHIRTISSHGERMPAKSTYLLPEAPERPGDQSARVVEGRGQGASGHGAESRASRQRSPCSPPPPPRLPPFHVKPIGAVATAGAGACFT